MPVFDPTPTRQHPPTGTTRSRLGRRALAAVTAPAAAAAVWALEVPAAGARLDVHFGPSITQVVGVGPVVGAAVLAGLAGWASLEILERLSTRPRRTWSALAVGVLVASLALPLTTAATATAMAALVGLHLAVGAAVIPQLRADASVTSGAGTRSAGAEGRRWSGLSRAAAVIAVVAVVAGGALAALTGASSASTLGPPAGGPFGPPAGFAPGGWGPFGHGPWAGHAGPGWGRGPAWSKDTEVFQVASTSPDGPGSIIITGVVDAGGVEHPGRAIDGASFAGGGFRIDHSSGHPTSRFDTATCVGTISQVGTFEVIDGTGRFAPLTGTGRYSFRATYTTARDAAGCDPAKMTAYIENIYGVVGLSPAVAHRLATTRA